MSSESSASVSEAPGAGSGRLVIERLPETTFGRSVRFDEATDLGSHVTALEADPEVLPGILYDAQGLLVLRGMQEITADPDLLVRLSRLSVRRWRTITTPLAPRIWSTRKSPKSSCSPICRRSTANRPRDPNHCLAKTVLSQLGFPTEEDGIPTKVFADLPPISRSFYAVTPCPKGQGQTLYANGTLAYRALPAALKQRVQGLKGFHVLPWTGRSEQAVTAGETPKALLPHQQPQHQPVVRVHPVTGKPALYLCEAGQMDWILGPFVGMTPGPYGDGAELLYEIMTHFTEREFTYVHDWDPGDLVIHDNRNLLHCATWYDASKHTRHMWRTTVMGNPGEEYAGEEKSWVPAPGSKPMDGLDDIDAQ